MIWLWAVTALSSLASLAYVFLLLAPELSQGFAQKIFFFHVPAAFSLYAALTTACFGSVMFLIQRRRIFDLLSRSGMIISLFFCVIVLFSGPVWARPIWGTYWTWDPRLTSTFILFILILSYHFTRKIFEDRQWSERGAVVGAILVIFSVADIPLIHWSVRLWRGIHPSVLKSKDGLPEDFQLGLELMCLSFFCLTALLIWIVYKILVLQEGSSKRS